MAKLFGTTVLAVALIASAAVGLSGAAVFSDHEQASAKADRLAVETRCDVAALAPTACPEPARYQVVEEHGNGISIITRMPVDR